MPSRAEVLSDGTIGGQKPLRVSRGLESLHAPRWASSSLASCLRQCLLFWEPTTQLVTASLSLGLTAGVERCREGARGPQRPLHGRLLRQYRDRLCPAVPLQR
jgi:hypothetical protein